jgi:uncharacterized membrane protein YgcG
MTTPISSAPSTSTLTIPNEALVIESTRTKITELMILASKLKLKNIENLCHHALEKISGTKDPARSRLSNEMTHSSRAMLSAGLPLLDINFNLRFSRKWDPKEKKSLFNNLFSSTTVNSTDYESVTNEEILNAPIIDICIIQRNEVVPEGYYRLSRTTSNKRADLNTGSTGHHLYLCLKKMSGGSVGHTPPITSLVIIYPDKKEYVPPGFSVVKRGGKPCNLNSGTSAERIFLCYKRDHACNPIIDLQIYFPTKNELLPTNFSKLSRSIRNYPVDLNMGTGAQPISFCFRYSIASLDCLIASETSSLPTKPAGGTKGKETISPATILTQQSPPRGMVMIQPEAVTLDLSEHWDYEKEAREVAASGTEEKRPDQVKRAVSAPMEREAANDDRDFSLDRPLSDAHVLDRINTATSAPSSQTAVMKSFETTDVDPPSAVATPEKQLPRQGSAPAVDEEVGEGDDESKQEVIADVMEAEEDAGSVVQESEMDEVDLRTTRIVTIHDEPIPRTYGHILRAVLASLFTTGDMFETALDTLNVLLLEDTIFYTDYLGHPSNENNLTMLDLTVHILCERLDGCVEVVNNSILQVLNRIILKSSGRISKTCVQKIFRATTFVATAYCTRGHWVTAGYPEPVQDDGKEIFAYTVLKELIKFVTAIAEDCEIDYTLPISQIYLLPNSSSSCHGSGSGSGSRGGARDGEGQGVGDEDGDDDQAPHLTELGREMTKSTYSIAHLASKSESYHIVCDLVIDFFDEVMDAVETSHVTEIALLAVAKKTSSTLSPSFWIQMNSLSLSLFRSYEVQNAFILLAALCKWSWLGIKTTLETGEAAPRHLGNKLLAIEGIRDFCRITGPKLRLSKIFGYQIRRIVVSSVFANMQYATIESRIFAKLLKLVSILWENWREQIRLEFPVICQQIMIKILHAPTVKMPPILHMIALKEIVKWFDQPHMLVEMFVNFDMDVVVAADWNIFAHIIRAICLFAEKASKPMSSGMSSSGPYTSDTSASLVGTAATMFGTNCVQIQLRDVRIKSLAVIANITRAIMDATGHANLIYMDMLTNDKDPHVLNRGWISKSNLDDGNELATSGDHDQHGYGQATNGSSTSSSSSSTGGVGSGAGAGAMGPGSSSSHVTKRSSFSLKNKRDAILQTTELLQQAVRLYHEKDSVGKAVKFLISKHFMTDTPHEIAGFIRIYKDSFDPVSIGDFLGEGGRNKEEEEYWNEIRYRFTRAVSFVELEVDDALRLYLTGCGFRMPGEAQKIDRFITAFVHTFWQDNHGTDACPFHHADTVHLLAYATIMLNTDLHRANIDKKKGAGKKMTKADFIKNLRGADQGEDINPDYLSRIYDNIATTPIEMEFSTSATVAGGGGGVGMNKLLEREITVTDPESHKKFFTDLLRNLRNAEDLVRSLSPYTHKFAIMGVDISISLELVSFMFESVWHYFHAIVDAILTKLNNEETVIFSALDVLCNSLTSCIFLDLKVEKLAFATQLARFRQICDVVEAEEAAASSTSSASSLLNNLTGGGGSSNNSNSTSGGGGGGGGGGGSMRPLSLSSASFSSSSSSTKVIGANFASGNFRKEKWFMSVEQSTAETAITAIAEVHSVISQIKEMIKQFARREITKLTLHKIEKKANLKDGSGRYFVLEGDLKKKNRSGKFIAYHFFLFSDRLVYAHQGFSEYKVHEQLELDCTSVDGHVRDDVMNCCFIIENPLKSFVVMAESSLEKQTWIRHLNEMIASCTERKRGQRLSILDRLQDQEKEVSSRQLMHENYGRPVSMRVGGGGGGVVNQECSTPAIEVLRKEPLLLIPEETIEEKEVEVKQHLAMEVVNENSPLNDWVEVPTAASQTEGVARDEDTEDNHSEDSDEDLEIQQNLNDPMLAAVPLGTPRKSPQATTALLQESDQQQNFTSPEGKAASCHSPDHAHLGRKKIISKLAIPKV